MDDQPSPDDTNSKPVAYDVKPRSLETLLAAAQSDGEDLFGSDDESDDDFLMAKPSALQEIAQLR